MKVYNLKFKDKAIQTYFLLRQTHILCEQAAEQALLDTGLTPETTMVLALLDRAKETVIPADLARFTSRQNQTIAGLVNRLEARGYVGRVKKTKGHPYTEVVITDEGRKAVKEATKVYKSFITKFGNALGQTQHPELQEYLTELRNEAASQLHLKLIDNKMNC